MHILNGQAVPGRNQGHQSSLFYFVMDFLVLFCVSIAVICKCFTEIMLSLVTGLEVGAARLHVLCPFSEPAGREHGRASQSDFRADGLSDVGRELLGCVDVMGLIDGDYMH